MVCAARAGWLCWCRGWRACRRPASRNLSGTFLGADVGAGQGKGAGWGEMNGPGGGSRARPPRGTERSCLSLLTGLCSRCFSLHGAGREGEEPFLHPRAGAVNRDTADPTASVAAAGHRGGGGGRLAGGRTGTSRQEPQRFELVWEAAPSRGRCCSPGSCTCPSPWPLAGGPCSVPRLPAGLRAWPVAPRLVPWGPWPYCCGCGQAGAHMSMSRV